MRKINGKILTRDFKPNDLKENLHSQITVCGLAYKIRKKSSMVFVLLKTGMYLIQAVCEKKDCRDNIFSIKTGKYLRMTGIVREDSRAPYGFEIAVTEFKILSSPGGELYTAVQKNDNSAKNRTSHCLTPQALAVFKIFEGAVSGLCEFLTLNGFTRIYTPKTVPATPKGTPNAFKINYFDKTAYLNSEPTLYTRPCVALFDRVFEVSPVFRREKHTSARHLCEYTALDFEMGFTEDITDIMQMQTGAIKYAIGHLKKNYVYELEILNAPLPEIKDIPSFSFYEALDILNRSHDPLDLDPTDEMKLCEYAKEKYQSEFVFVTDFPAQKRPPYARDASDGTLSQTFDLLFKGFKISSGGQWIHDYNVQLDKLTALGYDALSAEGYLSPLKQGMPPHGGMTIGIERLVMKLLNLENIREASIFPRDFHSFARFGNTPTP